ncbi:PREDICTED: uncharacterized protein LOC107881591 isoform X2 [Prunus mume]|uniref:Uncharacterized protein LOC107881591 isoform X2 n=1 Tax=Prunus mume TaxID=102107 RepID=A0ABM1LUW9_PRUMU|nr:PREDICTED: uncharacterized protein LOC107881591 isoform X2 [Prunus mume]
MGTRYISQFSASAAELTLGQGMMASRQDELLGKISEMEKSGGKISEMEKSAGKILEMEKTLGQLLDFSKSITQELRLLRPPSTVIENYNPSHPNPEAYDLYPSQLTPGLGTFVNDGKSRRI